MQKCFWCKVVAILAGLGALNWLTVAFFDMNFVTLTLGDMTLPAKIVYGLVGVSGLLVLLSAFLKKCPQCKDS